MALIFHHAVRDHSDFFVIIYESSRSRFLIMNESDDRHIKRIDLLLRMLANVEVEGDWPHGIIYLLDYIDEFINAKWNAFR